MKKILAIILALVMLLSLASLAACAEKKTETKEPETETETKEPVAETEEDKLANSENNEYVYEKIEAGQEVRITCLGHVDEYFTNTLLFGDAMQKLEALGFTCNYMAAEDGNIVNQITQIENLTVEDEVAAILIQTNDSEGIKDAVLKAQEAGITVVVYGMLCSYDTIVGMVDVYGAGYGVGPMASAWIDQRYPDAGEGDIHCAFFAYTAHSEVVEQSNGITDALAADPRIEVTYYSDYEGGTLEEGFNAAEAALLVDPDIKLFCSTLLAAAIGANNYLESQGVDFGEYAIFSTSSDDQTENMLKLAAENKCALRGTVMAGTSVPDPLMDALLGAFNGTVKPGDVVYADLWAWTQEGLDVQL